MTVEMAQVCAEVKHALQEDIGTGDVTASLLPADLLVTAELISREPMLVCGQPWVNEVFAQLDKSIVIEWLVAEGDWLSAAGTLAIIKGSARSILTAERTALNFLQTLSGTATTVYHYAQKIKNYPTRLLDTRKTLPGLRMAQKYAVRCAGGTNHRLGLYDAFLIKENHIKACGSIANAVRLARKMNTQLLVEIEVESLAELREAFVAQPDRILLDNFSQEMLIAAVAMNQPKYCELEASGGITKANIEEVARTGVDYISVGGLTKSITAIDLSLLIRE